MSKQGTPKSSKKATPKTPSYGELKKKLEHLEKLRKEYEKNGNHDFIVSEFESKLKEAQERITELEAESGNQNCGRHSEDISAEEKSNYEKRIKTLEAEKEKQLCVKEEEIRKVKETLMAQIKSLQTDPKERKLEKNNHECQQCIKYRDTEKEMERQLEELQQSLDQKHDADRTIQKLRLQIDDLKNQKMIGQNLQSDNERMKNRLESLQRDKETSLNQKLEDDQTIQQLRLQIDDLEKEKAEGNAQKEKSGISENNTLRLQEENDKLKTQVTHLKSELSRVMEQNDTLKNKVSSLEADLKSTDSNKKGDEEKDNRIRELSSSNMNAFTKLEKKDNETKQLLTEQKEMKAKVDQLAGENRRLKDANKNLEEKVDRLMDQKHPKSAGTTESGLRNEIQKLKEEKEALATRLSKMAGAQLTYNNPSIADLGDENRPMKLSEKYSEIYDNQWTDAFEEQENEGKSDREIVKYLINLLIECRDHCTDLFTRYKDNIEQSLTCIPNGGPQVIKGGIPIHMKKQLADLCKDLAIPSMENIQNVFFKTRGSYNETTTSYIKACISICWLMSVQDPPVVIDNWMQAVSSSFNTDLFKHYTKTGKQMDYVVWPPLYLCQNGSLLSKGVAQPL